MTVLNGNNGIKIKPLQVTTFTQNKNSISTESNTTERQTQYAESFNKVLEQLGIEKDKSTQAYELYLIQCQSDAEFAKKPIDQQATLLAAELERVNAQTTDATKNSAENESAVKNTTTNVKNTTSDVKNTTQTADVKNTTTSNANITTVNIGTPLNPSEQNTVNTTQNATDYTAILKNLGFGEEIPAPILEMCKKLCSSNPDFRNLPIQQQQMLFIAETGKLENPELQKSVQQALLTKTTQPTSKDVAPESKHSQNNTPIKHKQKPSSNYTSESLMQKYSTEAAKNKFLFGDPNNIKTIDDWNNLTSEARNNLIKTEQENFSNLKSITAPKRKEIETDLMNVNAATLAGISIKEFESYDYETRSQLIYAYLKTSNPDDLTHTEKIELNQTDNVYKTLIEYYTITGNIDKANTLKNETRSLASIKHHLTELEKDGTTFQDITKTINNAQNNKSTTQTNTKNTTNKTTSTSNNTEVTSPDVNSSNALTSENIEPISPPEEEPTSNNPVESASEIHEELGKQLPNTNLNRIYNLDSHAEKLREQHGNNLYFNTNSTKIINDYIDKWFKEAPEEEKETIFDELNARYSYITGQGFDYWLQRIIEFENQSSEETHNQIENEKISTIVMAARDLGNFGGAICNFTKKNSPNNPDLARQVTNLMFSLNNESEVYKSGIVEQVIDDKNLQPDVAKYVFKQENEEIQKSNLDILERFGLTEETQNVVVNWLEGVNSANQNQALKMATQNNRNATQKVNENGTITRFATENQTEAVQILKNNINNRDLFTEEEAEEQFSIMANQVEKFAAENQIVIHNMLWDTEYKKVQEQLIENIPNYAPENQNAARDIVYEKGTEAQIDKMVEQLSAETTPQQVQEAELPRVFFETALKVQAVKAPQEPIIEGDISSEKLASLPAEERRAYFEKIFAKASLDEKIKLINKIPSGAQKRALFTMIAKFSKPLLKSMVDKGLGLEMLNSNLPLSATQVILKEMQKSENSQVKEQIDELIKDNRFTDYLGDKIDSQINSTAYMSDPHYYDQQPIKKKPYNPEQPLFLIS